LQPCGHRNLAIRARPLELRSYGRRYLEARGPRQGSSQASFNQMVLRLGIEQEIQNAFC
jgi:hypothetical protein